MEQPLLRRRAAAQRHANEPAVQQLRHHRARCVQQRNVRPDRARADPRHKQPRRRRDCTARAQQPHPAEPPRQHSVARAQLARGQRQQPLQRPVHQRRRQQERQVLCAILCAGGEAHQPGVPPDLHPLHHLECRAVGQPQPVRHRIQRRRVQHPRARPGPRRGHVPGWRIRRRSAHAPVGMDGPRLVRQPRARRDLEPAAIRHAQPRLPQHPVLEHQGTVDLQVRHLQPRRPRMAGAGGGQRHLDHRSGGRNGGTPHNVVGQPRLQRGTQVRDPLPRFRTAPEPQQRMLRRGPGVLQCLHGAAQPVRLPLPRVGWQPVRAPWPGECLPAPDIAPRGMGARRRDQHRICRRWPARQGRQHPARGVRRRQRVVQVGLQHRLRPDFHEDADARRDQVPCCLGKPHRRAHVAPPVLGVQRRSVRRAAGHRGHEGQRRRIRRQARQLPRQRAFDRVHRRTVEGVVQVQQRERPARRLRLLAQCQQRRLRPGDRRGAAAVLRCDLDAGAGQRLGGCVGAQADHRHAPSARRLRLQAAPHRDHAAGLVQGQRPGRPGCRDLTHAVAHARIWLHARGPQRHDQRHLDRKQQGLRD